DQVTAPERDPHEPHCVNTPYRDPANQPKSYAGPLGSSRLCLGRFFGLPARARHEARRRLQKEREYGRRQQVGLADAERGQADVVPELAKNEAERSRDQDRHVRAPAVGQGGVEGRGEDQHEEHDHDQAGRDQVHRVLSAPSGPRGWVVLSELRWVPCLGSPSPVPAGFWSAVRTPESLTIVCWATRTSPAAHRERAHVTRPAWRVP